MAQTFAACLKLSDLEKRVHDRQCLSQSNSFDCGSHLCVNALQAIRETFPTVETLSSSTDSLSERQLIDNLRNDMRQIIHKLASEPSL